MDIYGRYYGEQQFSGGADHPDGVTLINSKATLGDEEAARLLLDYPHMFRNQPWDAVDMLDSRPGASAPESAPAAEVVPPPDPAVPVPSNDEPVKDKADDLTQPA